MKKNLKRILALFLAMTMCLGLLNLSVFAVNGTDSLPPVTIASQDEDGVTVESDDGASITGKKTIVPVKGTEDEFDITLEVTTVSQSTTTVTSQAADVVLVLDVTDSMDDDGRWGSMKTAVSAFVDKLLPAGNTDNKVAIVIYGGLGYHVLCDWSTDTATVKATYQDASDSDALRKLVETGAQGTNCQAGFLGADIQLNSARENTLKYVVYMTDGEANRAYRTQTCTKSIWDGHIIHNNSCYAYDAVSENADWDKINVVSPTDSTSSNAAIKQTTQLKANHPTATLIAVGFGTSSDNKVISTTTNTSLDQSYTTSADLDFDDILGDISDSITEDVAAAGTAVTDPMPTSYVTFDETATLGKGASFADGVLSWNLADADSTSNTVDGTTTTTYTLTYRIKVERNDAFYEAVKKDRSVPTNGDTTLPYTFTDADGNETTDTLHFVVPTVTSDIPELGWTIEYYKQNGSDYTKVAEDTETGSGEFGTQVVLSEQDAGYATKYANYTCVSADTTITLSVTGENVIRVYYDRDTTSATVNYHYAVTTINEQGYEAVTEFGTGEEGDPLISSTIDGLFVGDPYTMTVPETSSFNGWTFTKDAEKSNDGTIAKLDADPSKNVIDLFYVKVIDYREGASVVVNHVYTLHTYKLEGGQYVPTDVVTKVPNALRYEGLLSGDTFAAPVVTAEGFSSYIYEGIKGRDNVKVLIAGENVITLRFEDWADPRGPELSMTVQHHYTKTVTEIVDGKVKTSTDPKDDIVSETIKFYAGETVTISENQYYNGETYHSDDGNAAKAGDMVTTADNNNDVIDLYYTLTETPETTTLTVRHIYQTLTHETVTTYEEIQEEVVTEEPVLDDEGNPVLDEDGNPEVELVMNVVTKKVENGSEIKEVIKTDATDEVPVSNVYAGQSYTATISGKEDYKCQTDEVGRTATVAEDGSTVIEVYYLRDGDPVDNRDAADIDVLHIYTTHLTTIVGGEVETVDVVEYVVDLYDPMKAGDTFKVEAQPTDEDGNKYEVIGEEVVEKVLHSGTNSTIVFNYERSDSDLRDTSYTVNYKYYTRTMTVENDVAVWGEPVLETETNGESVPGYVGQKVTLEDGAKTGYAPYGTNPGTVQFLADGENVYTFQYVKDVVPKLFNVTVQHIITYKSITVDGETTDVIDAGTMILGQKYAGESYAAQAMQVGELTSVTVSGEAAKVDEYQVVSGTVEGDTAIVFNYLIVGDLRRSVQYSIKYYYYDVDYDGTETLAGDPPATTGSSYAEMALPTTPEQKDVKGYKLAEATFNGKDIMGQESVTLVDGANEVVYVYKRSVDTRPFTSVKVIHEYYANEAALETGAEGTYEQGFSGLRATTDYPAELVTVNGGRNYAMYDSNPAQTITLSENAEENVIVIRYIRTLTTYQVIHEYYTNNRLTGSIERTVGGNAGDVITADSIAKVTSYGGNTYTYRDSSGSLTLVQGENGAIVLRYYRTTGSSVTPTPTPTPTPRPEPEPEIDVPEPEVPLTEPEINEPEIDIPEPEVPLAEDPEIDIPEIEVPLADAPKTGDSSMLWWSITMASAAGLACLALFDRKRKEFEE